MCAREREREREREIQIVVLFVQPRGGGGVKLERLDPSYGDRVECKVL